MTRTDATRMKEEFGDWLRSSKSLMLRTLGLGSLNKIVVKDYSEKAASIFYSIPGQASI